MTNDIERDDLREAAEGHLRFGGGGDGLAEGVLGLLAALEYAESERDASRGYAAELETAVCSREAALAYWQARALDAETRAKGGD